MESVEMAALKSCNRSGEEFSVDDLLDFSNEDVLVDDEAELKMQRNNGLSASSNDDITLHPNIDSAAAGDEEDFGTVPTSELAIPMDDLAELEWLSNIVDDSSFTPTTTTKNKPVWLTSNRRHPAPPSVTDKPPLPVKTKPKRARTGVTDWSILLTDSSSSSSSDPPSPQFLSGAGEPVVKRQKKKKKKMKTSLEVWEKSNQMQTQTQTQSGKCCTHCGAQTTPQWRAGPLGPKTLCNACGVRFKSGRLVAEYRPACSPTFSRDLHSNFHRKVIELRRNKEMSNDADESGLDHPVQTVEVVPTF